MAFWDFLKDATTEKRVIKKTAGAAFNFLSQPDAVDKTAVAGRDLVVSAARGVARVPETAVRSSFQAGWDIGRKINPEAPQLKADVGGATDPIRRALYGSEPLETYQTRTAGNKKVIEGSRFRSQAAPLSFLGLGLTAGSDIIPNPLKGIAKGAVKKVITTATEDGLKNLAKASTEQEVRTIMKGTPPEIIDKVAPAIALEKDSHVIQNIIQKASEPSPIAAPPINEPLAVYHGTSGFNGDIKPGAATGKADKKNLLYVSEDKNLAGQYAKDRSGGDDGEVKSMQLHGKVIDGGDYKSLEELQKSPSFSNLSIRSQNQLTNITRNRYGELDNDVLDSNPELVKFLSDNGVAGVRVYHPNAQLNGGAKQIVVTDPNALHQPLPKPPTDPFNDINDALNGRPASRGTAPVEGIKSASRKNAELLSHERGVRFTASKAVGETASGSKGYFKELSQLKGKYDRVDLGGMIENIGPDQAESLFAQARKHIQSIPDATYHELGLHPQAARLNTQTAIRKVIFGENGGVPTASELKLIKVASPSLAKDIESKLPPHRKLFDLAAKLAGVPRALQSTGDLSMGGRQGLLVAARHPVLWARANKESVKYLKSEDYFKSSMTAIRNTPEYEAGHKYGVATPAADAFTEEPFSSADLVKKIPGVNKIVDASERAYNGGLTKLRFDLWKHTLQAYGGVAKAEEVLGAKGMRDLAEAVNTLTGRGGKHGGLADKNINSLSTSLFSPRLWAARLNTLNPQYYYRLSPAARKVALENAGAFAAVAGVVLGAAAAMGAEVETDPRSSDFLKIKIGDTRYDIFGGLQQNIVFAWREISGEKKNSQTGDVTKFAKSLSDIVTRKSDVEAGVDTGFGTPSRLTQASDLVSNKLSPIFAFGAKALEGKDRGGEPFNITSKNPFENEIAKLFIPINLQGAYDTSKNVGSIPKGVALNAPDTFGIGTQTYGTGDLSLTDKQKSELQIMKKNGASESDIKSTETFYQTLKGTPSVQHAGDKINRALAKGDLQGAQKIADAHNEKLAKNLEKWFEAHRGQTISKAQADALNSAIIELDDSSIERRLSSIQDNPVKYGG